MLAVPGAAVIPGPLAPPVQLIPLPIPLPVAVTADVFADVRVTVMPLVNDAFVDAARDPLNVTDDRQPSSTNRWRSWLRRRSA